MRKYAFLLPVVAVLLVLCTGSEKDKVTWKETAGNTWGLETTTEYDDRAYGTSDSSDLPGNNGIYYGLSEEGIEGFGEIKPEDHSPYNGMKTENIDNWPKDPEFVLPEEGTRPVAVMIDNEGTRPLPQGGIDKAQVVYEAVVEYGITRLMPVFWNVNPSMIGPVRSSRHYFLDYTMEHDAIYVHVGWSPMAQRDIARFGINNANGVANGGWIFHDITDDPYNWQDTYTSMEKILQYSKSAGYSQETDRMVFKYGKDVVIPDEGRPAKNIELVYSSDYNCGFEYDEEKGLYKRTRKGVPHIERVSGQQLECMNIIIQVVRNYTIPGDREGRQDMETVGRGTGYYITCGKVVDIEWSKSSRSEPTSYKDAYGNDIVLNPGRTWVQIMPVYGQIAIE